MVDFLRLRIKINCPGDVMIDFFIMGGFKGNIYSREEVRDYLLQQVSEDKRDVLIRSFEIQDELEAMRFEIQDEVEDRF